MNMPDIIRKKRDGYELTEAEIRFFVGGYNVGAIPDYQMSALLMAIYFRGLSGSETKTLTMAMAESGGRLVIPGKAGTRVDKHSSGGVGDKTTLIVGPMTAACGLTFVKMSGRGLGFTGGTIDKLEAVKGFRTELSAEEFTELAQKNGIVIMGQTENIAPADKKLYALRDVTATVDNKSLIAASIMSKKLACTSDAIVLDVKTGAGAFMKTYGEALELAEIMVAAGAASGRTTVAVITCMDEPLGHMVGNALEIKEAVKALKGSGPDDLMQVCFALGAEMLMAGGLADDTASAVKMLEMSIESGAAYQKFLDLVEAQGGDISMITDTRRLPSAAHVLPVRCPASGFVRSINAELIGLAAVHTGAGRIEKNGAIDHAAGIELCAKTGREVKKGDILAYVHCNAEDLAGAVKTVMDAYEIGAAAEKKSMVRAVVRSSGIEEGRTSEAD